MDTQLDRYERGPSILRAGVAELSDADLDAFPIPGTWSIRQIVVHMLDSDLAATHRMRRIAAENVPLLIAYDESAFVASLSRHKPDVEPVLRMFEDLRAFTAAFLCSLPPEAFARTGVHNQRGLITLADMVKIYADHVDHHMTFIVKKRALLGKPLRA